MITLLTGTPGSGKTLWMVSKLAKTSDFEGRKVFVDGITDLQIPTEPIPDGHTMSDMHVWLKQPENHGSVVIIDEAQRIFPPRSASSRAPEIVEFLHVHRHIGIDIYLITQMPKRIDANVRDLVGAHYHLYKNKLGMRTQFYWDYCATNPKAESRNAQASMYRLDSSVYHLYKSAEVHTKIKQPKTRWLMAIPIAFVLFLISGYWSYTLLTGKAQTQQTAEQTDTAALSASAVQGQMQDTAAQIAGVNKSLTPQDFVPTLAERPESKPIYDSVRQVKSYERIAGCVDSGKRCTCYSDQATELEEISTAMCKSYVKKGLPFDPFRESNPSRQTKQPEPQHLAKSEQP